MIRITSGLYKGRILKGGDNSEIRPTLSRVKLSFFDTVQHNIREKIFLDGFAGTGNIGIEAISRGADYVVFIDSLRDASELIRHNLEKIAVPTDRYRIIYGDFNRSVIELAKKGFHFDIIYLDPPYNMLKEANPLKVIHKRRLLQPDGMIVLERSIQITFNTAYFYKFRSKEVGHKTLDFFRWESTE